MVSHTIEMTREQVKDSMRGVLVFSGYLPQDYCGDLDNEILKGIDSLGVYEVVLGLEEKFGVGIPDKDIERMFGAFKMTTENFMNDFRNSVKVSGIIDYIVERL